MMIIVIVMQAYTSMCKDGVSLMCLVIVMCVFERGPLTCPIMELSPPSKSRQTDNNNY